MVGPDTLILASTSAPLLGRLAAAAVAAGYGCEEHASFVAVQGRRTDLDAFVLSCAAGASASDRAGTRALFLDVPLATATAEDVLGPALVADSIAAIAARATHGRLLDALVAGEGVHAVYQPVIEIRTGRTIAFEALLRMEHDGHPVPPLDVFRAATEAGRLPAADAAARRAALRGAAGWIGPRTLFLNLEPSSIARPEDLDATETVAASVGLDRGQIVFEASVPADADDRHLARVLDHLRNRGFGIGLDDVTDHRDALDLVARLRPGTVKIARSMIAELPGIHARSAVAAVVGAAHAVGARVVATGIETAAQLDAVLFVGVDDAQGWQVGQPMRAPSGRAAVAV